jgi:hypothetical protein
MHRIAAHHARLRLPAVACGIAVVCAGVVGAEPAPDFIRDVRPILERHCGSCHAGELPKSGLRLDVKAAAFAGGDGYGPAIVPGEPDRSPLVRFARGDEEGMKMPPADSGAEPLSGAEIATLVAWVQAGATWPDGVDTGMIVDRADHWSFKPVVAGPPPAVRDQAWPRGAIDRFILARLEGEGLGPSAEADRVTWLRRVTFDLTGLPPTPEEVDRFVADADPDAHELVVDRLLASPRYGERYAQHWLDVVRYADTHGYEVNTERKSAWPYRDYCVAAFNADTPYDRFIREQLAGDDCGQDAATGFLVTAAVLLPGQIGQDDASKRLARQDALNDIILNTTDTFLGLTVGCARCHDHKFDPVSQRDYYALQAFFSGVLYEDRPLNTPEAERIRGEIRSMEARRVEIDAALAAFEPVATVDSAKASAPVRSAVSPEINVDRFPPVTARRVRFTILETTPLGDRPAEACIDELEVYDTAGRNVALAAAGGVPTASGSLVSAGRHELPFVNDGRYGNGRSWLAGEQGGGWVEIEFPEAVTIDRVVWGRDRDGTYADRLAVRYRIDVTDRPAQPAGASNAVATDAAPEGWTTVADSSDRRPFKPDEERKPLAVNDLPEAERATAERLLEEKKRLPAEIAARRDRQQVFAGRFTTPAATRLLHRGDPEQPRDEVAPAALAVFAKAVPSAGLAIDAPEQARRRALADWIARPEHPLTARVMVNRIWQWHFGTGLVDSANDFGRNGSRPSHPELLDWLAGDFVAHGWSIKHLHRLIVLSATYRQGHAIAAAAVAKDADCRLLWRFPPRRLEAEAIRDSMLAVSGRLDLEMGGPGFDLFAARGGLSGFPPIESFDARGRRRMVYAHKIRMEKESVFGAFDCPDAGQTMARRRQSTTPLQALNLFNSPFTLDEAQAFAARVEADVAAARGGSTEAREATAAAAGGAADPVPAWVDRAFRLALSRSPGAAERPAVETIVREHGLPTLCRVLFNANEFLFIP